MNGTLDMNLWKRWDAKRDVWEGWKQYIYHKSFPLSHTKVQKTKPIFQLLKSSFMNCLKGMPPIVDCCISNFQRNDIFVFIAQCLIFFSHIWFPMLFCVYVLCPMINSSEKNKFVIHQSSVHLDFCYHKQFFTFQLAWTLLAMSLLNFGLGTPFFAIALFCFHH